MCMSGVRMACVQGGRIWQYFGECKKSFVIGVFAILQQILHLPPCPSQLPNSTIFVIVHWVSALIV